MFSGSRTVRVDARYRASVRAPATALSVVFRQHRSHAYPGSGFLRQQGFRACSVQGSRFADMLSEEINLTQMVEGIMPSYYTQKCSTFPLAARYLTTWLFIGSLLRYNLGASVIPSLQTAGSHVISPICNDQSLQHKVNYHIRQGLLSQTSRYLRYLTTYIQYLVDIWRKPLLLNTTLRISVPPCAPMPRPYNDLLDSCSFQVLCKDSLCYFLISNSREV